MSSQEKRLVIKSHWLKVLNVHTDWLLSKGYTEKLLGTKEPDGMLFNRIKESIEQAAINTFWNYRLEEFTVETSGLFDEGSGKVRFQFNYQLDPAGQRLFLTSVKASLHDVSMDFLIERNAPDQLPSASLVYHQLSTLSNNMLLNRLKESTQQLEQKKKTGKKI